MKRQTSTDEDGGLDALLDTMTNVVGILVLVLIVAQLGVADVVNRVVSRTNVDQQMLEDAQFVLEDKQAEREVLKQMLYEPLQIDVEHQREQLQRKEELLERQRKLLAQKEQEQNQFAIRIEQDRQKAEQIQQEMQQLEQQREELEQQILTALEEKAELEARLESIPDSGDKPADVNITVPNPRPAPEGAQPLTLLCAENQLYPVNLQGFREAAEAKAKQIIARYRLLDDPAEGIDPEEFTLRYEQLRDQDNFFDVEYFVESQKYPRLRFVPRAQRGLSVKEMRGRPGRRLAWIGKVDPGKFYGRFLVLPDSFEAYTVARRLFDQAGILAGWQPQGEGWMLTTTVPGIVLGPPPEPQPPPPQPPTNTPPAQPKPPPNVID